MVPQLDFNRYVYRILLGATVFIVMLGTIIFHYVEDLSWLDAYYFCVVTLATVGYGDITPQTSLGKFIATIYIFIGVGIITTFISYSLRRRANRVQNKHSRKTESGE